MKETRQQLADAMAAHALAKLAGAPWRPFDAPGEDLETRQVKAGEFSIGHTRRRGWRKAGEMLDVRHGRKVLALRDDGEGWRLVSMKRGDWESGFLLT